MSDNTPRSELAFMLGRIQGDVKHILEALTANNKRFDQLEAQLRAQDERMDKLEKFQVKMMTIVAIVGPILMAGGTFALRYIGG